MKRATYLNLSQLYQLDHQCRYINDAFVSAETYLVGSALKTSEYRDVDVRTVIGMHEFGSLFAYDKFKRMYCMTVSFALRSFTGLDIDYQVQSWAEAEDYTGDRIALGVKL